MSECRMCRYDSDKPVAGSWSHKSASYCPTQNSLKGNTLDGHTYRRWRKRWETEFGPWLRSVPPANKYRRVTITRQYGRGKRAFDRGNFIGGCKPLIDVLVRFGGLYDDTENWSECHYRQVRSQDDFDYVHVLIEEFP